MKLFVYCMREYDELPFFQKLCPDLGIEFAYTTEYPSMANADLARGYEAIAIITNLMTPELLDRFYENGVRYISTRSIGVDHIDLPYCKKLGIRVVNSSYSPNGVANYAIMMMLMACRKIGFIMDKAKIRDYTLKGKMGRELSNSTVGVIGTGKIGETVIRHLAGFGCKILAYDVYPKKSLEGFCEYVDLPTLYANSDIITLHVPGLPENHHMIGAPEFAQMKDGVILVNTARGLLVDTNALIDALGDGKVEFAMLDTFEEERGLYYLDFENQPMKNTALSTLSGMPNVMLVPHMAFYTEQDVYEMVYTNVKGLSLMKTDEENPYEYKF